MFTLTVIPNNPILKFFFSVLIFFAFQIWTPEVRYINPMPVVVLIDTATLLGGPAEILTPTSKLVHSREVIFVRPNFRLGVFGFLAAAPLSEAVYPPT